MTDIANEWTFLDNPHAPDVFADAATGFFVLSGNMRIAFEAARVNHITSPGPVARVVIGRLVMPLGAAESMAKSILDMIEKQKNPASPEAQSKAKLN